jgi:site-specific recombinase XerD
MPKLCDYCSEQFVKLMDDYSYSFKNARTYSEYVNYINMICNYLQCDFIEIDTDGAQRFMSYMYSRRSEGKLSKGTIYVRLHCYKVVALYVEEHVEGYESAFARIKPPSRPSDAINPKRIPTMTELDKFMSAVSDPMYNVIYALATRVGLSATSILNIRRDDITSEVYDDGDVVMFLRLNGKGFNNERYIALPRDVSRIFDAYLKAVVPVDGVIFFNDHHHPLTLKNLDTATKKYVARAGIGHYTMKDFRSRAILELVKTGTDLESIRDYTGLSHMRINTFASARGLVSRACPANLVNYELKVSGS